MKQIHEEKGSDQKQRNSPKKQSPKKDIPLKKKNSKGKQPEKVQLQEFKLIKLNDGGGSRRSRKTINYMKLNEGILC